MPKVLVPLADGSEEMEAVIIIDTLRRAGFSVTSASLGTSRTLTASRGVVLVADELWESVTPETFDAIVLPGGADGTAAMIACPGLLNAIQWFVKAGKLIGAICAAPLALQSAGVLEGRHVTCHPAVAESLTQAARSTKRVVQDGNLITSQGPGTAFEFALAVITKLEGQPVADSVEAGLILPARVT